MAVTHVVDRGVVAAWDQIAAAYQGRYQIDPRNVHLGPMVPPPQELGLDLHLEGKTVLDYGCGAGQNAIACSIGGASQVIAVDPSPKQLEHGRTLAKTLGIQVDFRLLGPDGIDGLPDQFDLILSVYALQFVDDIRSVFTTLSRRLLGGGLLVISVDHPVRVAGEWHEDDFILPDYFVQGWQSWDYDFPEQDLHVSMRRFRRPVSVWVDAVLAAGLRLTHLLEPPPVATDDHFGTRSKYGEDDPRNVFSRRRLSRIPGSLLLVAEREPI